MPNESPLLEEVCAVAEIAAQAVLQFYRAPVATTLKANQSPLTEADLVSHRILGERLSRLQPDWPVVSEEDADPGTSEASLVSRHWLIDPLDGTKEFLKGTDEFTVNVAVIDKGIAILGVVVAPALGLTYSALRDKGAWCRKYREPPESLRTRRADLTRLALVASKDHAGPQVQHLIERYPTAELRSIGSSLKFCLVAQGKADLYLRDVPTMEWDTAAAQCVVEAAGGAVLTASGEPLLYGKPGRRNPSLIAVGDPSLNWPALL
jgi:3'(2'), 5'-bisphosphate nucleotidase